MTNLPPLPPLPDPGVEFVLINGHQIPVRNAVCPFSGGQMRVYARAYGAACAAAERAYWRDLAQRVAHQGNERGLEGLKVRCSVSESGGLVSWEVCDQDEEIGRARGEA